MIQRGYLRRDRHGRPLPPPISPIQSPKTLEAFERASAMVISCVREARMLTSREALALAGGEARNKETLYSITCQFAREEGVDFQDLLRDLENRFPEYM